MPFRNRGRNMLTAVTERVGSVVRFNEAYLVFLSKFGILPHVPVQFVFEGKVIDKYLRTISGLCGIQQLE